MKKYGAVLLVMMFVVILAYNAHAVHGMSIPYEETYDHYKMKPRPGAGDMRYYITGHKPYRIWAKWPGKKGMYKGKEPHGALLMTYVNRIALKSIKEQSSMANNSIIIKENYTSNRELKGISVMYKVRGYNPGGGDWFWASYDASFNTIEEGKVEGCLGCHSRAKRNDYIFTGKVAGK